MSKATSWIACARSSRPMLMSPPRRRIAPWLLVAVPLFGPALAFAATGGLTQKPAAAGCVSKDGADGAGGQCAAGAVLASAVSVTTSHDGRSVYVTSASPANAVNIFDRDPSTGVLTQKPGVAGCVSADGSAGACTAGTALDDPAAGAVSADGASAYFVSATSNALTVFDRDPSTGGLTQKDGAAGCLSANGTSGSCTVAAGLTDPESVAVSPDGKSVYAASLASDAVAVFDRDPQSGALTQKAGTAGCVSETGSGGSCADGSALDGSNTVTVSPDGKSVYVASLDAVAIFDRDPQTGALTQKAGTAGCVSESGDGGSCADGMALTNASGVAVSPDGDTAYVSSAGTGTSTSTPGAVAVFARGSDGSLAQLAGTAGCTSQNGYGGLCADGTALDSPQSVAVSPDGTNVYAASFNSSAVAVFDREPSTGALTQEHGDAGCVAQAAAEGCRVGRALSGPVSAIVSPDGTNVYAASFESGAVSVFDLGAPPAVVVTPPTQTPPVVTPVSPATTRPIAGLVLLVSPVYIAPGAPGTVRVSAAGRVALKHPRFSCPADPPECAVTTDARAALTAARQGYPPKRVEIAHSKLLIASGKTARLRFLLSSTALSTLKRRHYLRTTLNIATRHGTRRFSRSLSVTLLAPRSHS